MVYFFQKVLYLIILEIWYQSLPLSIIWTLPRKSLRQVQLSVSQEQWSEVLAPVCSTSVFPERSFHIQSGVSSFLSLQSEAYFICNSFICFGAHGGAVGSDTALQVGSSRVRFPMVSLEFFINIILPTLELTQPLRDMNTRNISWG